jgi:hypothetical protein
LVDIVAVHIKLFLKKAGRRKTSASAKERRKEVNGAIVILLYYSYKVLMTTVYRQISIPYDIKDKNRQCIHKFAF